MAMSMVFILLVLVVGLPIMFGVVFLIVTMLNNRQDRGPPPEDDGETDLEI